MKKKILFSMLLFSTINHLYAQVVTTFAGTVGVHSSINGTGTAASFTNPQGVAVDASGNVYVADGSGHRIRMITPEEVVSTFAGSGSSTSTNGTGIAAGFNVPYGIAVDASGNLYVAEGGGPSYIRKITPEGVVTTLAGGGSGTATNGIGTAASFAAPTGIVVDADGNVYVADQQNNRIRKITAEGEVTTLAGSGSVGHTNGPGASASFYYPSGIALDASGNVYVGDEGNHLIRKITPEGVVSTFAGTVGVSGSANGTGTAASFKYPYGLASDASGNIYVADSGNDLIRKITSEGVVSTIAGTGSSGAVNGIGTVATFKIPTGIALDAAGNVYVADKDNYLIRKITMVTTAIEESTSVSDMKLYPNPVTRRQRLTLALTLESQSDLKIELISLSGIAVASTEANYGAGFQELILPIESLPTGIYVANVYSNTQMTSQRVVIE